MTQLTISELSESYFFANNLVCQAFLNHLEITIRFKQYTTLLFIADTESSTLPLPRFTKYGISINYPKVYKPESQSTDVGFLSYSFNSSTMMDALNNRQSPDYGDSYNTRYTEHPLNDLFLKNPTEEQKAYLFTLMRTYSKMYKHIQYIYPIAHSYVVGELKGELRNDARANTLMDNANEEFNIYKLLGVIK